MVYRKIHDNLYGIDCLFFSGCDISLVQKKANRVYHISEELTVEKNDIAAFYSCSTKEGRPVYIIWVKKSRDIPTIAHEVVHLVYEIFKDRGVPAMYANQETFAYYHSFWMDEILKGHK